MKKRLLAIAAAAAMAFGFSACENSDLFGSIKLEASNAVAGTVSSTQAYAAGDSVVFMSALSNVKLDSLAVVDTTLGVDTTVYNLDAGTLIVGSVENITKADFESLTYPLCGINLRGDQAKTYPISCPIDKIEFFKYLDTSNVNNLIANGLSFNDEMGNLFAVAVSEDAFYIGYDGNVVISKFGGDGSTIDGKLDNVKCVYVTVQQIEALAKLETVPNLDTYFPTITFNGTITSRRLPLDTVLKALEDSK